MNTPMISEIVAVAEAFLQSEIAQMKKAGRTHVQLEEGLLVPLPDVLPRYDAAAPPLPPAGSAGTVDAVLEPEKQTDEMRPHVIFALAWGLLKGALLVRAATYHVTHIVNAPVATPGSRHITVHYVYAGMDND